tara:strand:+ start:5050 stop:6021 length:972 start_codon:yes stop_codon:yes gene_type:complete
MNIVIAGCGNIGFRHLESILGMKQNKTIYIVDQSKESLARCQNLTSKITTLNNKVNYFNSFDEIKTKMNIDVAIIASGASSRADIIKRLFLKTEPCHLILEKLLFTKISDFAFFSAFFKNYKTKVWVNQWLDDEVRFLSDLLPENENFNLNISGSQWGLCCNSVHFIEWFHAISSRKNIKLEKHNFINLVESKRPGFFEIIGNIQLSSDKKNKLVLNSDGGNNPEESINIDITSLSLEISCVWVDDNLKGYYKINNGTKFFFKEKIKYQSQRTSKVINDLMYDNKCKLPSYEISCEHHMLFYPIFYDYFESKGFNTLDGIPIT